MWTTWTRWTLWTGVPKPLGRCSPYSFRIARKNVAVFASRHGSVNLSRRLGHGGIELDFAEGLFVLDHVLLQDGHQRFGLLRAQVDSLEVLHLHLACALRLHAAEDQQEVPNADAHLHGVGVALAVFGGVDEVNVGLGRNGHGVSPEGSS